ncbi:anthrone oxygenase family protein [Micromonospora sp. NPDC003197]
MHRISLPIVRAAGTLLLGLFTGGMFCLLLAPSVRELPAPAYIHYWQALNTDYPRNMPPLLLTCLALLLLSGVLSYRRGWWVFGLTGGAALLVAATVVLTVAVLEPINHVVDTWSPDAPPADWAELRDRWWRLHTVRTALVLVAFAGMLAVQVIDRPRPALRLGRAPSYTESDKKGPFLTQRRRSAETGGHLLDP